MCCFLPKVNVSAQFLSDFIVVPIDVGVPCILIEECPKHPLRQIVSLYIFGSRSKEPSGQEPSRLLESCHYLFEDLLSARRIETKIIITLLISSTTHHEDLTRTDILILSNFALTPEIEPNLVATE